MVMLTRCLLWSFVPRTVEHAYRSSLGCQEARTRRFRKPLRRHGLRPKWRSTSGRNPAVNCLSYCTEWGKSSKDWCLPNWSPSNVLIQTEWSQVQCFMSISVMDLLSQQFGYWELEVMKRWWNSVVATVSHVNVSSLKSHVLLCDQSGRARTLEIVLPQDHDGNWKSNQVVGKRWWKKVLRIDQRVWFQEKQQTHQNDDGYCVEYPGCKRS